MTPRRYGLPFALIALALSLLSACEPLPPGGPTGPAGPAPLRAELQTAGAATVRVNGFPAQYGQRIRSGDSVETGPGASALIAFSDGTSVQLDERSGPVDLRWRADRLVVEVHGSLLDIVKGAAFSVVEVITDLAEAYVYSHVVVEMRRGRMTRFDLFDGRLQLVRPASPRGLSGGDYVRVDRGVARPEFGRTSPAHAQRLRQRFDRWNFRPVPSTPVPPPAPTCPDGQRWDPIKRVCACPPERPYWQDNQCITCVGGMVWTGRQCECPEGTRWRGDRCAQVRVPLPIPPCAGGQRWDPIEQICACPPERPYWQDNQCITCVGGMVWNGRNCECPSGTRWDGRQCARTVLRNPRPVPAPPAPPLLQIPAIVLCPQGEVWSAEAGKCLPVVQ